MEAVAATTATTEEVSRMEGGIILIMEGVIILITGAAILIGAGVAVTGAVVTGAVVTGAVVTGVVAGVGVTGAAAAGASLPVVPSKIARRSSCRMMKQNDSWANVGPS
jgi:hypothetical protein